MLKTKIINFEWICDCNHIDPQEFETKKVDLILEDIRQAASQGYNYIIGIFLMDGFLILDPKTFLPNIQRIKEESTKMGIKGISLLSGQGEQFPDLDLPVYYFDYTLRMTYNGYKHCLDTLPNYNGSNNKFLFLGGAVARPNRVGLMSKFYDQSMLDNCEWTFFPPWSQEDDEWCKNYLPHYSEQQYTDFLKFCDRNVDRVYENAKIFFGNYTSMGTDIVWYDILKTDFIKNPTYIDPVIFKITDFSIITEGINYWPWSTNDEFVTEKFWRTVANSHPFIFSGHPDQYRYIQYLGFKTFEEYMLIKDYALIEDEQARLNAVVENTRYFLENQNQFKEQIQEDVAHNKELMIFYIDRQDALLHHLREDMNVDQEDIDFYLDRMGYEQLIRVPPNGI